MLYNIRKNKIYTFFLLTKNIFFIRKITTRKNIYKFTTNQVKKTKLYKKKNNRLFQEKFIIFFSKRRKKIKKEYKNKKFFYTTPNQSKLAINKLKFTSISNLEYIRKDEIAEQNNTYTKLIKKNNIITC
jgi:hypothetical protein